MAGNLLNFRVEPDLRAAIDDQREKDGATSVSMWAREALAGVVELGGLTVLAEVLKRRRNGGDEPVTPHSPRALALQGKVPAVAAAPKCQHPKTALRILPYATTCTLCGTRVR